MKQIITIFLVLFLTLPLEGSDLSKTNPSLPLDVNPKTVLPLIELLDKSLQLKLEDIVFSHPSWRRMIQNKKMTIGIVDLTDPSNVLFARINGNVMMYAASLPKLAILLTAFHCFEHKIIKQTPEIMKDLNLMIRKSDNRAATRMIEKVTMERIQQVLTLKDYEFYDENHGGGLWVGKKYAQTGKRIPDPLKGLSHAATASQVCRFYYQLAMGKLINKERSREMLEILINPGIEHKFVKVLRKIVPEATLFRKSGTWKTWHSDSVLVWGPEWRRYIAVALIDNKNGEDILRKLIPELETVLKLNAISMKTRQA
ncbi:MAG: class A beta-lactamase-related serine hydrolase [Proteobacteria bacterium]|nr:class A beta-lactamase-related serine hydrolase [Pseudomonadota bacterium]MBU1582824.1 class A beta-lactamase-related serine hydrolase [Pseudomonadota bacterium]MBU2452015.1 class A beta-lactamase-related serine hydrolase [Pseudomonadota bacterium]MBU2628342.1 class A beta-lactamase-related serine hydrolase [Pseudomonadota bacterium]